MHAQNPHIPWRDLPSGKHYVGDTRVIPGLEDRTWTDDPFLVEQGYERYLLEVGYTDRVLGILLRHLHESGLYDRALVIVMADHGVSFTPGLPRRDATAETMHDLSFVPLFIKLPEQKEGRVQDGFVRTIDVLPTITDLLGIDVPEPMDGRSLLEGEPEADGVVRIAGKAGAKFEAPLSRLLAERDAEVAHWTGLFGTGGWNQIYLAGPRSDLVGKPLDSLNVGSAGQARVELDGRVVLANYDPDGQVSPAWVTGRVSGVDSGTALAVAVNGSIAATTKVYKTSGGETRLAVFVPESSLAAGENEVDILVVGADDALSRIAPASPSLLLEGGKIRRADGKTLVVVPAEIHGLVRTSFLTDRYAFTGWAVDDKRGRPVDAIAVFADGELVYVARGKLLRTPEPERHGGVDDSAFTFKLPASVLPAEGTGHDVRVFAMSGDRVAELDHSTGFAWG